MKKAALLSLVIPTKNRYSYLTHLVRYLSKIESKELEIIIQDNSEDNTKFQSTLKEINDQRIKYYHHPDWLSVSDNCEMSINHANGEFVCMIGDDDGITPHILDAARWMKISNIDAILSSKPTYHWPGIISRLGGITEKGRLLLTNYTGSARRIDVDEEFKKVLDCGGTHLHSLPRVYHGIVARKCLDQLRNIAKTCFPGPSPDMSNAIGLSSTVKTMYYIDIPLIINGNCASSAGGLGARGAHHGEIHNMKFLPPNLANSWPKLIPYFWSGPTILAASAVLALINTKRSGKIYEINLPALYSTCLVYHYNYKDRIYQAAQNSKALNLINFAKFSFNIFEIVFLRAKMLAINIFKRSQQIMIANKISYDVSNIENAINYILSTKKYQSSLARLSQIKILTSSTANEN